jgi:hypothetical protein
MGRPPDYLVTSAKTALRKSGYSKALNILNGAFNAIAKLTEASKTMIWHCY